MICDHRNFIFVRVAKTGSSSIIKVLFPKKTWRRRTKVNDWEKFDPNHYPLFKIKEVISKEKYESYFKFAFVRNPYDRCLSAWKYSLKKGFTNPDNNFPNYVKHLNQNNTDAKYFSQYEFVEGCDFVGKLENLQEDFNIICDKIGIPQKQLPHINKSKHKHYTEYYDEETKQIVAERYAKDIEYFRYEFGE